MATEEASAIARMIQEVIADGKLTAEEKKRLDTLLLEDGQLSLEERRALDELLGKIARGEVVVGE
jgi:polyhydroxyalkanoate synthesis regulator phasin